MSRTRRLVQRLGLVLGAGALAAGAAALVQHTDGPIERLTVNTRFAVRGGHAPSDKIVIVAFDNRTLRALDVRPPVPRETQAQVIDRLDLAGAAAVAFDYSLEQSSGDAEADRTLALALMNARRAIVSVTAPERNGDVADLAGFIPFSDIDVVPGYTPLHLDPEGVVRSFTRPPRGVSTFPLAAARHSGPAPANAIIDYPGPAGTFASLSYVDVLHGHFDPKAVRGRIAIIGSTATVLGDAARVPVDSVMPGPEIHAAAIATALDGFPLRTVSRASGWRFAVLAGLAVPLALVLLPRRRRGGGIPLETPGPLTAAALGVIALLAWLVIAQLAFNAGTVVDVVPAVAAIMVATTTAALACEFLGRRERRRIRERFASADLGLLNRLLAGRANRRSVTASDIVAGYTIAGRLQMGGMGVVYRAVQDRLDRKVALKLIRPEHALDPRYRRRFVKEVHRTAGLAHPNIVPVVDAGESDGVLFIAMPFIDGPDLAAAGEALQERGPSAVVRVLHRVACALDAAHRTGLIHRDVKPANVLLAHTSPEHPVLIDFGVALEAGELGPPRQGTPAYLAPERSDGTGDDQAADVYALAVMLFELLTGELPFKGTPEELRDAHRNAPRPSLGPAFPPALDAVIARGMAVAPEERYRSATALTHAAAAVLGVEVVDDAPPPVRRPPAVDDGLAPTLTDAGEEPRRRWWHRLRRGV